MSDLKKELEKHKEKENILINNFRKAEKELKKQSELKSRFLAILSHDLKSPLYSIKNLLYLIQEEFVSKKEIKSFSEELEKITDSTIVTLENLLQWTMEQISSEGTKIIDVLLIGVIDEILKLMNGRIKAKQLLINLSFPDDIKVRADINQLRFIFRNLLSNSIKFTNSNGLINISAKTENDNIIIIIEDNGIGMSEEMISKLFQADKKISTKGTHGERGTGLGLILCKEFAEKNNGSISLKSELGKGTSFYITLKKSDN